ncbi:unnamed protein product [Amoebophrya sp. A120]|nr:unnamed protein product [Amoebophrya sp. A120]|eukprot:GSA120T00006876001.1
MGAPSVVRTKGTNITAVYCSACRSQINNRQAMTMFYDKFCPQIKNRLGVRRTLENNNWGTRKQVGIYSTSVTHPPNSHIVKMLNNAGVKCQDCGAHGRWSKTPYGCCGEDGGRSTTGNKLNDVIECGVRKSPQPYQREHIVKSNR